MTIPEIKKAMLSHKDFYGGDIIDMSEIESAKTKKELSEILERHRSHLDMMAVDADSHHSRFVKKLGLHLI